jgi:hypothetical protein
MSEPTSPTAPTFGSLYIGDRMPLSLFRLPEAAPQAVDEAQLYYRLGVQVQAAQARAALTKSQLHAQLGLTLQEAVAVMLALTVSAGMNWGRMNCLGMGRK